MPLIIIQVVTAGFIEKNIRKSIDLLVNMIFTKGNNFSGLQCAIPDKVPKLGQLFN